MNNNNNNNINNNINYGINKYSNSKTLKTKKEEDLDRRNYLDAEETREFAYSHLKATIDNMKNNF